MKPIIVLCTTNNQDSAKSIAKSLVEEKLCACVNIIPNICSIYRWEDKIETDEEYLMLIKTGKHLIDKIKNRIIELHSYDVPEVVVLDISDGSKDYLDWIGNNIKF